MRSKIGTALVLAALAALAVAAPAHATFPGGNGKIAFSSDRSVTPSIHCDPGGNELQCADIWTMNADGTEQALLQSDGSEDSFPPFPAWSPDGTQIAFTHDYRPFNHETDIFVMDANGGNLRPVTSNFEAYNFEPTWSPDGTQIAFQNGGAIYKTAFPPAGEPPTGLVVPSDAVQFDFGPDWSPDGTLVAFTDLTEFCSPRPPGCVGWANIDVVDPNSGQIRALTTGQDAFNENPSFSPDGRTVLFSRDLPRGDPPVGREVDLYTVPTSGGTATRLTDTPTFDEVEPVWSPDGTKIAFTGREQGTLQSHVYTINADGTGRQQLTSGSANDGQPDWQPIPRPPGPQRSDYKNAAQFCKAERDFLGDAAFTKKYGGGANAYGKCVSAK